MQLIDSHCHLNYDYSPKSTAQIVKEAQEAGVVALVSIGTDLNSIPMIQSISSTHDCVYYTVGIHPHDAAGVEEGYLKILEAAAAYSKCQAIGEIGLDYHYEHSPREVQKKILEEQLNLALHLRKPVVIHSRDGEEDLLQSLTVYAKKAPGIPGVIHCFSGSLDFGRACVDLGFYLSFSGIITFKKADELREIARNLPLDRMLVETDAPFLAPLPHRGKKCEPAMVLLTAQKLAEIKAVSLESLAEITTQNSCRLFNIQL